MHDPAIFHEALRQLAEGQNAHQVAMDLGVPWGTVRYWHQGKRRLTRPVRELGVLRPPCEPGNCPWMPVRDKAAYVYLLGVYLGDGTIQKGGRTAQLRVFLDDRYPAIQDEVVNAMTAVASTAVAKIQRPGCTAVTSYSLHWRCVFPQHGPGRKHKRAIHLTDWQQQLVDEHAGSLLRGMIHTDGCRSRNVVKGNNYPRYEFRNRSRDIHGIFRHAASILGLRYTGGDSGVTVIARRADVTIMDQIVGPKR